MPKATPAQTAPETPNPEAPVDATLASNTAVHEELAEAQNAIATLTKEVEALKTEQGRLVDQGAELASSQRAAEDAVTHAQQRAADADAAVQKLQGEVVELNATITRLTSELEEAAHAKLHVEPPSEDRVHTLWCDAGGFPSEFEKVKRFLALLQG